MWFRNARYGSRPHPWVAQLTGPDRKYKFQRIFIKPLIDYEFGRINTDGIIGVYFVMAPGYYEIYQPLPRLQPGQERFLVQAVDSELIEITQEELCKVIFPTTNKCSE